MIIPTVTPLGSDPIAHPQHEHCGHTRHVGTCPVCQRAAQRRSEAQLAVERHAGSAREGLPVTAGVGMAEAAVLV
jgi:hypothetical protein